jgi:DNA-binding transcriptional MerR regulator
MIQLSKLRGQPVSQRALAHWQRALDIPPRLRFYSREDAARLRVTAQWLRSRLPLATLAAYVQAWKSAPRGKRGELSEGIRVLYLRAMRGERKARIGA